MEHLDDFIVSLRDADGEYHSWRRDLTPGLKVALHDPLDAHWELLDRYTNADMQDILAYLETQAARRADALRRALRTGTESGQAAPTADRYLAHFSVELARRAKAGNTA
jgi:hypothetical protein